MSRATHALTFLKNVYRIEIAAVVANGCRDAELQVRRRWAHGWQSRLLRHDRCTVCELHARSAYSPNLLALLWAFQWPLIPKRIDCHECRRLQRRTQRICHRLASNLEPPLNSISARRIHQFVAHGAADCTFINERSRSLRSSDRAHSILSLRPRLRRRDLSYPIHGLPTR